MINSCSGLHYTEQRKRVQVAVIAMSKVRSHLEDLIKNPEAIVAWEIAQGNCQTLLDEITEALTAERLVRAERVHQEFNSRTLFGEVSRG